MSTPRSFEERYAECVPMLDAIGARARDILANYVRQHSLQVTIEARTKECESAYLKLQKGGYRHLMDLEDLVGVRLIGRSADFYSAAQQYIEGRFLVRRTLGNDPPPPNRLDFEQPRMIATLLHDEYPNPDTAPAGEWWAICLEFQLTTELTEAVNRASHAFVYKGPEMSWRRDRLMSELRGMVGLAETILSAPTTVAAIHPERSYPDYDAYNEVLCVSSELFGEDELPADRRRFAIAATQLLKAARRPPSYLKDSAIVRPEIPDMRSLSALDRVLALLIVELTPDEIAQFASEVCRRRAEAIVVPVELLELCPESRHIPEQHRVSY